MDIDITKFNMGHEAFMMHMQNRSNGIPFTSFQHPFLVKDEIAYKWAKNMRDAGKKVS